MFTVERNCVLEFSFQGEAESENPSDGADLDVVFGSPAGREFSVPAFRAGGGTWKVRFSSDELGRHSYRAVRRGEANRGLHGVEGLIDVRPYEGTNPLYLHGPLCLSAHRKHLQHSDGTPFLWLGDTWWYGLSKRLSWPGDFRELAGDRVSKGFSVIQIVAGPYPGVGAGDSKNANEAGLPWEEDMSSINPAYFDMADLRIEHLVSRGLVPCIFGAWGFHVKLMGTDKMKRHWRHLVARYGAYPVVWSLTGEALETWPHSKDREGDKKWQKREWTLVARYVREIDGYSRLLTVHPVDTARSQVEDESVLDFDMLQTGHYRTARNTVKSVREAVSRRPLMPVVNGEVAYEGILGTNHEEVQRFMFWALMLSGGCGHTYGANGLWQVNKPNDIPVTTHGVSWGTTLWTDAYRLPGSTQVGIAKKLLEEYRWWQFEPHQEWVSDERVDDDLEGPFAAGIPGEVRIIYISRPLMPWTGRVFVEQIETDVAYKASLVNTVTGERLPPVDVKCDADGRWEVPQPPVGQDWVVVLDRAKP
ncbi:MAG: apiosidase-like domain-containing protein [Planctomycetota bacterium]|jgi:hypothetical protein